jgi:K+-transporting ATPase ATPase A chain
MNTELLGVILTFVVTVLLAIPMGKYIAKVFAGEKTILDFLAPIENLFFKLSGIDARKEMTWKESLLALLTINFVWFLYAIIILMVQGSLPLNPDHNPSMSADLAFNTAISFLVNCNLQDYSGESGVSYLTQIGVLMFLQFVSAATGVAALAVVFNAMKERTTDKLGNFDTDENLVTSFHYSSCDLFA